MWSVVVPVNDIPTASDALNAVVSHSGFGQLKSEVERCHSTLAQLDTAVHDALKQFLQQTSQVVSLPVRSCNNTV